jgi:hypothetical protein
MLRVISDGEEAIVGEKADWGLPHNARSSRNVHRPTGNERGMVRKEAVASKELSMTVNTNLFFLMLLRESQKPLCSVFPWTFYRLLASALTKAMLVWYSTVQCYRGRAETLMRWPHCNRTGHPMIKCVTCL